MYLAASASFSNAAQLPTPVSSSNMFQQEVQRYQIIAHQIYTFSPVGPTVGAGGLISGMTVGTSYNSNQWRMYFSSIS